MFFGSWDALRASLEEAGLAQFYDQVARSVRPAVYFQRERIEDRETAVGASKLGGLPDLPADFDWPVRPPLANAETIAEALRGVRDHVVSSLRDMANAAEHEKAIAEGYGVPITQETLDQVDREYAVKIAALGRPFPLAFIAQLDLAKLSREAGFDPAFPDSGYLWVFEDPTSSEPPAVQRLFWRACAAEDLVRTPIPQNLIQFNDGITPGTASRWSVCKQSALLVPHSVLSVPHHWKSAFPRGSRLFDAFWDWFMEPMGEFWPESDASTTSFGDHFGGWPRDIQQHVEDEIDGARLTAVRGVGETTWRHVFSYGGEYYQGDMLIERTWGGDGNFYVMIRDTDLADRRFDKAGQVYQAT